ncbi:hypothetical protein DFH09DRAFT_1084576 [Mycena vulgaris]|nr:hypothetical protein DFH09DRAFT_1084576 [Mycena vulgaris]
MYWSQKPISQLDFTLGEQPLSSYARRADAASMTQPPPRQPAPNKEVPPSQKGNRVKAQKASNVPCIGGTAHGDDRRASEQAEETLSLRHALRCPRRRAVESVMNDGERLSEPEWQYGNATAKPTVLFGALPNGAQSCRVRNEAITALLSHLRGADDALAALYTLEQESGPSPALPKLTAKRMADSLDRIRRYSTEIDWRVLPDNPEVMDENDAQSKGKGKEVPPLQPSLIYAAGSDHYFEKTDDFDEEALDPKEHELVLFLPTSIAEAWGGKSGVLIHVIIYVESRCSPIHALCWAPTSTSFDIRTYRVVQEWPRSTFTAYSVGSRTYERVTAPVDMVGRGQFMIYLKSGVSYFECPRLGTWEQRAQESASAETAVQASTSVASSSKIASTSHVYGSSGALAVASFHSTSVAATPVASSSKAHCAVSIDASRSSGKRKAEDDMGNALKKVKAEAGSPGSRLNPLLVASSGLGSEMEVDSDVEIIADNWSELCIASSDSDSWSDI